MISTKFIMTRDIGGQNGYGIMPTKDIYNALLAVGVAQSVTVPDNYANWIAIFSYTPGATVFVAFNETAAAPSGAFAAAVSALNPAARKVKAGDVLSFITADATNPLVSVEFQIIQPYTN